MGTTNPGRVNVVTTPWSDNWLTHNNDAAALTDLGFSAWAQSIAGDASAAARRTSIDAEKRYCVDVTEYGADPTGVADSYAAIMAADAVSKATGRPLLFPAGVYLISNILILTGIRRAIWGYGAIVKTDADRTAVQLGDAATECSQCTIEGIQIENGAAAAEGSTSRGIKAYKDCWKLTIRDVFVGKYTGEGFGCGIELYNGGAICAQIENVWCRYNQVGIYGANNGVSILNPYLYGGKHGLVLGILDANNDPDLTETVTTEPSGTGISIVNPVITQKAHATLTAYGIFVKHTSDFPNITGGYFEAIGTGATYSKVRGTAIQVGVAVGTNHVVKGGGIYGPAIANVAQPIAIGGTWQGGNVEGVQWRYRTTGAGLIDAVSHYAGGTSTVRIGQNYIGTSPRVLNPAARVAVWEQQFANPYLSQSAKTEAVSPYACTIADGLYTLLTNGAATAAVTFNLPAVVGYVRYRFRKESNYPVYITPVAGQTIQGLAASETLELVDVGDEVELEMHQTIANSWVINKVVKRQAWRRRKESTHDYGGAAVAWTMTINEASASLFTVTNANGAADAVFPTTMVQKEPFTVYNNSGFAITFKVSGQAGSSVANGKRALFIIDGTDCREIYEQP